MSRRHHATDCHRPSRPHAAALAWTLAWATSSVPAVSYASGPSPASPSDPSVDGVLRVEVEDTVFDPQAMRDSIVGRHPDLGTALAMDGHEQWVELTIGGSTLDYHVRVAALRDGQVIGPPPEPEACACTTDELLDMVDQKIDAEVERLLTTPLPPKLVPKPPEPDPPTPPPPPPPRRRFTGLGIAGLVTGSTGLAAAISGGVMLRIDQRPIREPGAVVLMRDYSLPGGILVATGSVVALVGGALLAIDLTRCSSSGTPRCEDSRGGRAARVRTIAILGPESVGIAVSGRF